MRQRRDKSLWDSCAHTLSPFILPSENKKREFQKDICYWIYLLNILNIFGYIDYSKLWIALEQESDSEEWATVMKQQLEWNTELLSDSELGTENAGFVLCLFRYLTYVEGIKRNAGLEETRIGIKIAYKYFNSSSFVDNTMPLWWLEVWGHLNLWLKGKEENVQFLKQYMQ